MQTRLAALLMGLILALAPAVLASGRKSGNASVTFHLETESTDNPKMIFPQLTNGQTRYYRRMPEITSKDMVAFSPFPSETGEGYGIIFKLKPNAVNRLAAVTSINTGRWMISQINGRIVDGVLIDKQINDGFIVIWKGVTLADVATFDESLPRIDAGGKKK